MKRFAALIATLILGVLACSAGQSGIQTAAASTQAFQDNVSTSLAATLAASAPTPIPTLAPPTETLSPTDTPEPTSTPEPNFTAGTIPMRYGDWIDGFPGQDTAIYGFQGTKDDTAIMTFGLSNYHPQLSLCKRGMRLSFYIRDDKFQNLDQGIVPQNGSTTKTLQLPYSGDYYMFVSCQGSGCATFCAEVKVTLDRK
jgi:hypothetical protein